MRHFTLLLFLAACAGHDDAPDTQAAGVSHTEQVITLSVGDHRDLPGGATIGVSDISSDSRCPANVQCIWAGSAAVAITFSAESSDTAATLNSGVEPKAFSYRGWHVRLRDVNPGPGQPKEGYRVTLGVGRD
jgi:hypothetical protein